jgi:hypothetical protein
VSARFVPKDRSRSSLCYVTLSNWPGLVTRHKVKRPRSKRFAWSTNSEFDRMIDGIARRTGHHKQKVRSSARLGACALRSCRCNKKGVDLKMLSRRIVECRLIAKRHCFVRRWSLSCRVGQYHPYPNPSSSPLPMAPAHFKRDSYRHTIVAHDHLMLCISISAQPQTEQRFKND